MIENENVNTKAKLKKFGIPAAIAVVVIAIAFMFLGSGDEAKVAKELKAEIEQYRDGGAKKKFIEIALKNYEKMGDVMSPEEKARYMAETKKELEKVEVHLEYDDLDTRTADGVGYVKIEKPVLNMTSDQETMQIKLDELEIGRDASDANHQYYNAKGKLEMYSEQGGVSQKLVEMPFENLSGETKYENEGKDLYSKLTAKNLTVIEGRGNTNLVKIESISQEQQMRTLPNDKSSSQVKMEYLNIVPGDFIKIMTGINQPITFRADYTYDGDDFMASYMKFAKANAVAVDGKVAPMSYESKIKINNGEILMGNSGLKLTGDVEFKKDNQNNYPYGTLQLSVLQYAGLLDFLGNVMRLPPANATAFLKESGIEENGNIIYNISFDGSEKMLINGRSEDEVTQILDKNFQEAPMSFGAGAASPSADGVMPSTIPQVQQRPLQ